MDGCFHNRIYQEGSEASAAVVAVETHTIHKLEEGIGEFLLGVGRIPSSAGLVAAELVSPVRWASFWLCPCRCCFPGMDVGAGAGHTLD